MKKIPTTPSEPYQPLHLKYRPQALDDVVGNSITVKSLRATLARPGRPHAYLFTGPSGCGKTTLARIVARELGAEGRDFTEMNSASYRGIDSARNLIANSSRSTWGGKASAYLLDEIHQLTGQAEDALLKLLEEPPPHVYYLLATTEPEQLKATLKSRCAHFVVQALPRQTIQKRLLSVVTQEQCPDTHPTDKVLSEIARVCGGSLRQALVILDQVIDIRDEQEALDALVEAAGDDYQTIELCRALQKGLQWKAVRNLLNNINADPEQTRRAVLAYLNTVMLGDNGEHLIPVAQPFLASVMYTGKAGLTIACYNAIKVHTRV